ncbi:MAG TPA: TIM barrel protein [Candidatus Gallacutalibacter stercoravium]|nr:TIM barrel protein [Candidatus Gallacutalibacter stercoravium]
MAICFGPAGQCRKAKELKLKSTWHYLDFVAQMGLNAFEYSAGRGVNIGEATAQRLGSRARELGIVMSLHAPYYISLASREEEKREKSVQYILDSALAVSRLGGNRIVVHPGGLNGQSREEALRVACATLQKARRVLDENGFTQIAICPETMGKISQLGTLEEVIKLCLLDDRMLPCVDFGHLNARTLGGLQCEADFAGVLDEIGKRLGQERLKSMHIHFSKIAYSAGGEVRHLTFEDESFGPDFEPLMLQLAKRRMEPVVICESAGTQSEDALQMQEAYRRFSGRLGQDKLEGDVE